VRTVHCDRCGEHVRDNVLMLRVEAGKFKRRVASPIVDLCDGCAKLFEAWMGSVEVPAAPEGVERG
jgi:hypothetical protein